MLECSLEDFHSWFYETYKDTGYEISEGDEADFRESIAGSIEDD
jgi:hypothetical protein